MSGSEIWTSALLHWSTNQYLQIIPITYTCNANLNKSSLTPQKKDNHNKDQALKSEVSLPFILKILEQISRQTET